MRKLQSTSVLAAVGALGLAAAQGPTIRSSAQLVALTPEQHEILEHLSIVYLDDGRGGTTKAIRFTGVNVQIVNGLGATNGYPPDPTSVDPTLTETNGVGNLIVGYGEPGYFLGDDRTGSHNVVLGTRHRYSSFGGLLVGDSNRSDGAHAAVTGGSYNAADGDFSHVTGGDSNEALGAHSSIQGGEHNTASGFGASIAGGFGNLAVGSFSAATGGVRNIASGNSSSVLGGALNHAAGDISSVAGGESNRTAGLYSSVSGGYERTADGVHDWRAGMLFQEE